MATDDFNRQVIKDWSAALMAIRTAGGHHVTVPVADMAVILHAAETNTTPKENQQVADTAIDPETAYRRPFHYEANTKDGKEYLVIQHEDDGDACFVTTRMSESGRGTQMPIRIPPTQFEAIIRALCAIDDRPDPFAEIEQLRTEISDLDAAAIGTIANEVDAAELAQLRSEVTDLRAKCEQYRQAAAASRVSEDILQANINALAAECDA